MFDSIIQLFNLLFTNPIINVLVACYQVLSGIGLPFAFGFSIILLTILIRLLLYPFTAAQIKSAHLMQKVAPHIAAAREKHKNDSKKQQEEMMRLYKEHGVNPAAGCLPLLIQFPIIYGLYHVLDTVVKVNSAAGLANINKVLYSDVLKLKSVWDPNFFGLSLGQKPSELFATMPLIILVPILTGVLQFVLTKMMMPEETPGIVKKGEKEDFQTAFQKQSLFLFPAMIAFASYSFPLGLSLYWNTFTLFGILQQHLLVGPGAMGPMVAKLKKNGNK